MVLKDTEETRKIWNKKFTLLYKITLKESALHLNINVKNEGDEDLDLTFCFHTYFTTTNLESVQVTDLKGLTYTDKTIEGIKVESRLFVQSVFNISLKKKKSMSI